jgi:hypothetical protein
MVVLSSSVNLIVGVVAHNLWKVDTQSIWKRLYVFK